MQPPKFLNECGSITADLVPGSWASVSYTADRVVNMFPMLQWAVEFGEYLVSIGFSKILLDFAVLQSNANAPDRHLS